MTGRHYTSVESTVRYASYHNQRGKMKTTGLFEIHQYRIPFQKYGEPVYVIPFGDIHRSAPLCHEEKWLEFLGWAKKKKNCYFLGMGDYDDLVSTSERESLMRSALHDSTVQTIETMYRRHTDRLIKEMSFFKGKTIGLLEGNHFAQFQNGETSTQRMCEALECKYLGCSAFIRIILEPTTQRTCTHAVDIWAHHGLGAARLVGGSLNRVQQMGEAAEFDVGLMGHDHKKSIATVNRLKLMGFGEKMRLAHRKVLLARTGSFLKGYVPGEKSYVADGMMNPTDLGVVKIELTPKRIYRGGVDSSEVDLHASI
jgi:hypothetical protein